MTHHPFTRIEEKWQKYWKEHRSFKATEDPSYPKEKRRYVLDMFPYPSSAGLHVGHPEGYTATDIYCRYLRMRGYNVLHPMGWDSFGLPAETYAIQTGTHPLATTENNIRTFRAQVEALGFSYDWDREVATHRPEYYRWTQWIFLQLYKRGLAYQADTPVWYCEKLGTVLANEEVLLTPEGPRSERGGHPVVRKPLKQWMLKITEYAERLEKGLDTLDWPESIKRMQKNWIGRSEGASIVFRLQDHEERIEVFSTRPDTLFGATYLVLAPEHPFAELLTTASQQKEVSAYIQSSSLKSDLERTDLAKQKTGVFTGSYATNPATGQKIPVWIADYVLYHYGTGAIMAVPAHDSRDWDFAKKYALPIVKVVADPDNPSAELSEPFSGEGVLVNSGEFDGQRSEQVQKRIGDWLEARDAGKASIQYKMRDWIFSRQRYWGEPMPLLHFKSGDIEALSEDELPLTLPEVESYQPSHTGLSPLAKIDDWVQVNHDGTSAQRETHTMPQWAGSCWYYLRFLDPHNKEVLASREAMEYWMPVDLYIGGAEHAVLHLLYARFWHMVLYDMGIVNTEEPFQRLVNQGMILGEDGMKMSKSLGNVINPDEVIAEYGADALRMYEMFMGPLQSEKPWATKGIHGIARFLDRVWQKSHIVDNDAASPDELQRTLHKTIAKVQHDIESLSFNTAIAQLMICLNAFSELDAIPGSEWDYFLRVLSPFAPHLCEELWEQRGHRPSISRQQWPAYDEEKLTEREHRIAVQVNGKLRDTLTVAANASREYVEEAARARKKVAGHLADVTVRKVIVVPNRIINFVVSKE